MKYILNENIALRSWRLVPYAYYIKGCRNAKGLKKDEYALLKKCDGSQDIADSALLQSLFSRGFCRPAKDGEALSEWQREKVCDNRYFPAMNWMITGKCNYNCLHCFNAADNSRLQSEFTLEEAEKLIREAEKNAASTPSPSPAANRCSILISWILSAAFTNTECMWRS